jgi:Ca2+-transporting ATPase
LTLLGNGRLRDNPWLTGAVAGSLALQAGTVLFPPLRKLLRTTPISASDALIVAGLSMAPSLAREVLKRAKGYRP